MTSRGHWRWPWAWIAGGAALLGPGLVGATPHTGMLSGPTARTWWDASRTALGYGPAGAAVTPKEKDVDRDPEEAEDDAAGGQTGKRVLTPMQRQMIQGVVAEYVIYLKYLNLENFKNGPVDWRNERFQYIALVPLKDIAKPNAPFRVAPKRITAAINDMEDILVEIGAPAVPLVAEALKNDLLFHGSARRRRPPLDYRTPAGVPAGDYAVQALEKFDDLAYGLGNHPPFTKGKSDTFVRNEAYRTRTRRVLLQIGKPALPRLEKLAGHHNKTVAEYFAGLVKSIKAGELPPPRGGAAKPFAPPPMDPAAKKRAADRAAKQKRLAAFFSAWQKAEVALEAGAYDQAIALYRELLKLDPNDTYQEAAHARIALARTRKAEAAKKDGGKDG